MNGQLEDWIFFGEKIKSGLSNPLISNRKGIEVWGHIGKAGIDLMRRNKRRGGQTNGRVVMIEMVDRLDKIFSEGIKSNDGCAFVVFE